VAATGKSCLEVRRAPSTVKLHTGRVISRVDPLYGFCQGRFIHDVSKAVFRRTPGGEAPRMGAVERRDQAGRCL
jgi:hypothetical protein